KIVARPVWGLPLDTAILYVVGEFVNGFPNERNARCTPRATLATVHSAAHARRAAGAHRRFNIDTIDDDGRGAKKSGGRSRIRHLHMLDFGGDVLFLHSPLHVLKSRQIVWTIRKVKNFDRHRLRLVLPVAISSITGQPRSTATLRVRIRSHDRKACT